jgi:AcrR family transcriptional regulator
VESGGGLTGIAATGQRGQRSVATSYAIELAALALFVERGFDAVTADQIADAAGVSVRTVFRHFPEGKDGVLLLETRRGVELFEQALRRRPPHEAAAVALREAALESIRLLDQPTGPYEAYGFSESMQLFGQIMADHPELLARMMGERQMLMDGIVELIALRMSVDPSTDVRPRLLLHTAHAAITVAWLTAFADPASDRYSLLQAAFEILEQGTARAGSSGAFNISTLRGAS